MSARAIPTQLAHDAAAAFADLLRGRTAADPPSDAYFARDWTPLWTELADGGWTLLADGLGTTDGDLDLLDLTLFAEAWGAHLVPLPFIESIAARSGSATIPEAARMLSVAVWSGRTWLVPFGQSVGEAGPVDDFARSLPLTAAAPRRANESDGPRATLAILETAGAVGAASAALARSIAHARAREQFGRPIGSFQAVKHRLADMHARIELARSAVAWSCAEPDSRASALGQALELCLRSAEDAVQVHGGIGFTWEAAPHHYLRHVMAARAVVRAALGLDG